MKKKLMELCLSPDLGGLELYMARCFKALDDVFDVISVVNPDGKLRNYFEDTPYRVETLKKKSNLLMFGAARKLAKLIDKEGIDIIHLHWTKDLPIAVLATVLSKRKPKLVQSRHMVMTRFKNDFYHRFLYKHIDLMLAVTKQVAEQIKKYVPEKIRPQVKVLYPGADVPALLNEQALEAFKKEHGMTSAFNVGMVGRIEEAKGQYLLIDAIAKLQADGVDAEAYFVGHAMQEEYLQKLEKLAEANAVLEKVHFLGFLSDPVHFMQACDVIVLATEAETFGLVLVEAMMAGTAVIGSNRGGPLEIIDDGENGLLFESMSSQSLSQKLSSIYGNKDMKKRLSANGKEKAEKLFSNQKHFQMLAEMLGVKA